MYHSVTYVGDSTKAAETVAAPRQSRRTQGSLMSDLVIKLISHM